MDAVFGVVLDGQVRRFYVLCLAHGDDDKANLNPTTSVHRPTFERW